MDNYDFCAHFADRLAPNADARILDYGCGDGTIVTRLRARNRQAFGCDVFYEGGSHRSNVPADLREAGVIRDMPDGRIPHDDDTFDLVISNQVFEHVPDFEAVLDEIQRVLKPGGILLFLFPDRSIWREGHCGVPLMHRFGKGTRLRVYYAAAWRAAGFGFHKGTKSVMTWSRDFCDWLDRWTFYRSYAEIRRGLDARFTDLTHHEAYWLATRFGSRVPMLNVLPAAAQRQVVRRWAGMVATCRKPSSSGPTAHARDIIP
jgi:SAM-dependent methyltransferase